jgi:uncharacterized protein YecT (DUF1311 family)
MLRIVAITLSPESNLHNVKMFACGGEAAKTAMGANAMISLTILAAATSLAAQPAPAHCPGDNTLEINACLAGQLEAADTRLGRYVAAARTRVQRDAKESDDAGGPRTLADFDKGEKLWSAYREAACGAVYDAWSGGTIRGAMELTCELALTRAHTHDVWSEWLTYMDSTPPILPEPAPKN